MGPKKGVNTKVEAAREHQAKIDATRKAKKDADMERQEAQVWAEGANNRGAKRQEEVEQKQLEKMARAAEKKKLEQEEAAALAKTNAKKAQPKKKAAAPAPWEAALQESAAAQKKSGGARERAAAEQRKRDEEAEAAREARRREAEATAKAMKGMVVQDHLATENKNRDADADRWASGIDAALGRLEMDDMDDAAVVAGGGSGGGAAGAAAAGRNPNMKALYRAFEDREMMRMREELPGLKLSQYKDRIFELWRRSPENPMNRPRAARAADAAPDDEA